MLKLKSFILYIIAICFHSQCNLGVIDDIAKDSINKQREILKNPKQYLYINNEGKVTINKDAYNGVDAGSGKKFINIEQIEQEIEKNKNESNNLIEKLNWDKIKDKLNDKKGKMTFMDKIKNALPFGSQSTTIKNIKSKFNDIGTLARSIREKVTIGGFMNEIQNTFKALNSKFKYISQSYNCLANYANSLGKSTELEYDEIDFINRHTELSNLRNENINEVISNDFVDICTESNRIATCSEQILSVCHNIKSFATIDNVVNSSTGGFLLEVISDLKNKVMQLSGYVTNFMNKKLKLARNCSNTNERLDAIHAHLVQDINTKPNASNDDQKGSRISSSPSADEKFDNNLHSNNPPKPDNLQSNDDFESNSSQSGSYQKPSNQMNNSQLPNTNNGKPSTISNNSKPNSNVNSNSTSNNFQNMSTNNNSVNSNTHENNSLSLQANMLRTANRRLNILNGHLNRVGRTSDDNSSNMLNDSNSTNSQTLEKEEEEKNGWHHVEPQGYSKNQVPSQSSPPPAQKYGLRFRCNVIKISEKKVKNGDSKVEILIKFSLADEYQETPIKTLMKCIDLKKSRLCPVVKMKNENTTARIHALYGNEPRKCRDYYSKVGMKRGSSFETLLNKRELTKYNNIYIKFSTKDVERVSIKLKLVFINDLYEPLLFEQPLEIYRSG